MARVQVTKEIEKTLTVSHDASVTEDLQSSREYRSAFLTGSIDAMLNAETDLGKLLMRKYVNGTIGFVELGQALNKSSKTLMQMLSPKGNPNIQNFFDIVAYLQKLEKLELQVVATKKLPTRKRTDPKPRSEAGRLPHRKAA